ncbi:DUF4153 domain-containing protein [Pigmentiphaga litoralis]|uniref:DUF4153 domain-containing protein n=1 Tax=Pigmentiphaga litoralis TaxID=516702 RepID=UPI00167700B7|nr:DUF4153 domain-containing protein [Pigmentiphaga litoralis]GGX18709.1 DUF4153 domain-containing protein [Pigmentiphaga litoralis]
MVHIASTTSTAPIPHTAPRLWLHVVLGAAQGAGLWALFELAETTFQSAYGPLLVALMYATAIAPSAWHFSHDGITHPRARIAFAAFMALLFAGFGAHAAPRMFHPVHDFFPVSFAFVSALLAFVMVCLACGVDIARRRIVYGRLFEMAWRNAMLVAVAGAITGLFWMLLWSAASLMESIGLTAVQRVVNHEAFRYPVTGAVLGLSIGLGLTRPEVHATLRRFWFALTVWLLPVALVFAAVWVAALAFTGIEPLFATRHAALYLLWFCALAVKFVNVAYRFDNEAPAYRHRLARALQWLWLTIPVFLALAGWALLERTLQHGLTTDRLWGGLVWVLLAMYGVGYAMSLFRLGPWMHTVPSTNIAVAIVGVLLAAALISPVADSRRLVTADQVNRLEQGKVTPEEFDWRYLATETGPYGRDALARLAAQDNGDTRQQEIKRLAAAALVNHDTVRKPPPQLADARLEATRQVPVKPDGQSLDDTTARWLADPANKEEDFDTVCLVEPQRCAIWMVDIDNDGEREMVVMSDVRGSVQALLHIRSATGWQRQGRLGSYNQQHNLEAWLAAIDRGDVHRVPRRWPDVKVGNQTLEVFPY